MTLTEIACLVIDKRHSERVAKIKYHLVLGVVAFRCGGITFDAADDLELAFIRVNLELSNNQLRTGLWEFPHGGRLQATMRRVYVEADALNAPETQSAHIDMVVILMADGRRGH